MRNRTIYSILSLLLIGGLAPLRAQTSQASTDVMDMSLEDLMKVDVDSVYGASGYRQKIADAPASITIVTADEIRRYGYRTLSDVLRHVPGFYITSDRLASHIGVRGFGPPGDYNSRILVLLDRHRACGQYTALGSFRRIGRQRQLQIARDTQPPLPGRIGNDSFRLLLRQPRTG